MSNKTEAAAEAAMRRIGEARLSRPQTLAAQTIVAVRELLSVASAECPSKPLAQWTDDEIIDLTAQAGWTRHLADCSMLTLHRLGNTWYTGANVPGKARGVMPYTGGVGPYRGICNEVVSRGMLGFSLAGPNVQRQCNDGEIVRLQPDVRSSRSEPGVRAPSRPSSTPLAQPAGRWARSSNTAGRRWFSALSSLSAGNAGAASDRGLLPWRRLGVG